MSRRAAKVERAGKGAAVSAEPRATYRHGDLRAALLAAGLDLAREGGPDAVVLRGATRRGGGSPNAAYRHFADRAALLAAVSDSAQGLVAERMEGELAAAPHLPAPDARARRRSRADAPGHPRRRARARRGRRGVARGYLRFAEEQPGLFRAAFFVAGDLSQALSPS